jgi:hypothetical protein
LNHRSGHIDLLLLKKCISHSTILPQIVLFISKTMLIFSYRLSTKINISFLINLKLKKIMYLNVSPPETMLSSKNIRSKEYSYNSYDDIGIF